MVNHVNPREQDGWDPVGTGLLLLFIVFCLASIGWLAFSGMQAFVVAATQ